MDTVYMLDRERAALIDTVEAVLTAEYGGFQNHVAKLVVIALDDERAAIRQPDARERAAGEREGETDE